MAAITDKIFGTHSQREIKRINSKVDAIEALRPKMKEMTDDEMRAMNVEFKKRLPKLPRIQASR